ncbi:hypothetical protein SAMN05428988_0041 [Chitinophaga sp. YR573]|nr:hypothetical protein SAMN05428988_0041 [Chitinophaga sp. YR573]
MAGMVPGTIAEKIAYLYVKLIDADYSNVSYAGAIANKDKEKGYTAG